MKKETTLVIWVLFTLNFIVIDKQCESASILSAVNDSKLPKTEIEDSKTIVSWSEPLPQNRFSNGFALLSKSFISGNDDDDRDGTTSNGSLIDKKKNCTEPSIDEFPSDFFSDDELRHGAIIFHIILSCYIFYSISYLCETFFIPSIEQVCRVLHVPTDIAGATFMAIGTSSPEFFTNLLGTFLTKSDIGVGSVVGSVVFNLLAIVSWCGLAAKEPLKLDWWPLSRDCGFYVFSVLSLIAILYDGKVYWFEALILVLLYFAYLVVITYNKEIEKKVESWISGQSTNTDTNTITIKKNFTRKPTRERLRELLVCSLSYDGFKSSNDEYTPLLSDKSGRYILRPKVSETSADRENHNVTTRSIGERPITSCPKKASHLYQDCVLTVSTNSVVSLKNSLNTLTSQESSMKASSKADVTPHKELAEEEHGLFEPPWGKSFWVWLVWVGTWPARFVLHLTIPDCRTLGYTHWYPLTFLMCIVYMAIFSYIITWMMTVIGHTFWIPDSIMGIGPIAAGTSLPEAVSSILVARQGLGTMSISNSVGSNTFNILLCLGLPWLIRSGIVASSTGLDLGFIPMAAGGFGYVSIFLVVSAVILYGLIAWNRYFLDFKIGVVAISMYVIFLVLASMLELNMFFPVNLPICGYDN